MNSIEGPSWLQSDTLKLLEVTIDLETQKKFRQLLVLLSEVAPGPFKKAPDKDLRGSIEEYRSFAGEDFLTIKLYMFSSALASKASYEVSVVGSKSYGLKAYNLLRDKYQFIPQMDWDKSDKNRVSFGVKL